MGKKSKVKTDFVSSSDHEQWESDQFAKSGDEWLYILLYAALVITTGLSGAILYLILN